MLKSITLGTVAAAATGTAVGIGDLRDSYVTCTGTYSATWYVEVSLDGTTFVTFDSGSADKLVGPIPAALSVRLRVGAGTGSVVGVVGGNDAAAGAVRNIPLTAVAHTTTGSAVAIGDLVNPVAVIAGTFSATWYFEVSMDGGTTWKVWDTDTAAKYVTGAPRCSRVRVRVGAGSGSVTCTVAGVCYEAVKGPAASPGLVRGGVVTDITTSVNSATIAGASLESAQVLLTSADFVGTYTVQVTLDGTNFVAHTTTVVAAGATKVAVALPRVSGFRVGATLTSGTLAVGWSGSEERLG